MNFEELLDKARQGDERAIATLGGELSQFMVDDPIPIEEGDKNLGAGEDVLRDLAEDGNAEAQFWLGRLVLFSREEAGKELDYETLDWWERAANQGHAGAARALGRAYELGWGDAGLDIVKAAQWYRMGAERGDKQAREALGQLDALREQAEQWSDDEAPELLWENLTGAMDEGKVGNHSGDENFARFVLGRLFLYGNDAVSPNMERADNFLSESGYGDDDDDDDDDDYDDDSGDTPLIKAAENGDLEEVKAQLASGVDVNARDNAGWTALMTAVAYGSVSVVRELVKAGADLEAKNNDGQTALMRAASKGAEDTLHELISAGADVHARDNSGWTALMRGSHDAAIVRELAAAGADVHAKNDDGQTALMCCVCKMGDADALRELIEAGGDVNATDDEGKTALDYAEQWDNPEMVELLRAAASGAASADAEDDDAPLCLSKGETLSLGKKAPGLQKLLVGLGWDVNEDGGDFDLDASAFLLGENGKCAKVKDVVFYGSLEHPSGAVKHLGDNRTGKGEGDDEQLVVDLAKAPESVTRIVFAVSIHEAGERGQTFGQVENAFIRVVDEASGRELARYEPASEFSDETALVVGELYRDGDDWQFRAVGDGLQGGLAALCGRYGIKTA